MSDVQTIATALPKLAEQALGSLPKVSEEDLQKIRSFLPGKLLARTAALLSLALLVLGFIALGKYGLSQLGIEVTTRPWLGYGLLVGLPAAAVLWQIAIEWYAERNRRLLKQIAVQTEPGQSGYFRIGPYLDTVEDRAQFRRADNAHEKVLRWIETSRDATAALHCVPLYLTGDSGSGKSSILNAWVLPTLRERNWTVIEARAWQDPGTALRDALLPLLSARRPRQDGEPALRALIENVARRSGGRLLIVLDQFEEFIILGSEERQKAFAALVADLRNDPVAGVVFLLVLRSDYQMLLEELNLPVPRYGENLFQVGQFTLQAAGEFLTRSGLGLPPESIDRLLSSAAELDETPGFVRPITVNVIGYVLAASNTVAPSLEAGQLVHRYIAHTVGQPAIRDLAPPVLEQLITGQSTKRPRSEEELSEATHLRRGEVRAVLNSPLTKSSHLEKDTSYGMRKRDWHTTCGSADRANRLRQRAVNGLGAAALVRPLDPAAAIWELSHDFIARAVGRYLGRRRRALWRRGASFAAPVLLVVALVGVAGVWAFDRFSPYQLRVELAELGLTVTATDNGMALERNSRLTPESFGRAGPLVHRLGNIRSLDLSGTPVADLEPLKGLSSLQALNLFGTPVTDLEPLKGLSSLQTLSLYLTQVANLEPLKGLSSLQTLSLYGTQVAKEHVDEFRRYRNASGLRNVDVAFP